MYSTYKDLTEVPPELLHEVISVFDEMSEREKAALMEEAGNDYTQVILNLATAARDIAEYPELTKFVLEVGPEAAKDFVDEYEAAFAGELERRVSGQQKPTPAVTPESKPEQTTTKAQVVDRAFDLSVIKLDCNYPVDKILEGVKNFATQLKEHKNKVKNCCILLSGKSGIGKSEFSRYLADTIGLELTVLRASDILDPYVGKTEKNIASHFKEASNKRKILLIDEADSLFRSRQHAEKSWEVTQTNEMLCQMEAFEGILVCSTNLIDNFDKAVMRRFVFKIKFLDLTPEGKAKLAKSYLTEVCDLPYDLHELMSIQDLRPGDFKTVRDRLLIVSSIKVSYETLLDELKAETSYRDDNQLVATL